MTESVGSGAAQTVERAEFSAESEEAVEEYVRQTYMDNHLRFVSVDAGARFHAKIATGPELAADRLRCTIDYAATTDPADHYFFIAMRGGRAQFGAGDEQTIVMPGESAVYPVGLDLRIETFDMDVEMVRLPVARIRETATELGSASGASFRLEGASPISPARARLWSSVLHFANSAMLSEDSSLGGPLLVEELTRTVAMTALQTFPSALMTDGLASPQAAPPSALRRATAFIEANADTPLTVTEIAGASGVTPRALQLAFRRHLDTTPIAHLRRVRLAAAHRDLRDADPDGGETVAAIARRWGFAKPGRFSAYYRAAYGQLSRKTLGR